MKCPICKSDHTRRFSIIYEEGTVERSYDNNSDGSNFTSDHSSFKSKLAKRCSPPVKPAPGFLFALFAFIVVPYFMIPILLEYLPKNMVNYLESFRGTQGLIVIITCVVSLALISYITRHFLWGKRCLTAYLNEKSKWDHSWICLKCGNDFQEKKSD